ncbi:MAG: hypothetical protein KDA25_10660, partial [Phycisphaerales bacterium]|nr:hypothetical protein [Phycisphaerales bacterium]
EAVTDRGRRFEDTIDLRVSGVEGAQAVRGQPENASEQEHEEQRAHDHQPPRHDAAPDEDHPHIDLQA